MKRNFSELLANRWKKTALSVGLDPDLDSNGARPNLNVNPYLLMMNTVTASREVALAFKPNGAFYLGRGKDGQDDLEKLCNFAHSCAPEVPIILDCKFGDIRKTNKHWAKFAFDICGADAVTINPYVGGPGAFEPFLEHGDKGVFVLCRTSNPEAGIFQDKIQPDGRPLYQHVAEEVAQHWNFLGNVGLVVGATAPTELRTVREIPGVTKLPILMPGIGKQGGAIKESFEAGCRTPNEILVANVSSGIMEVAWEGEPFGMRERLRNKAHWYYEEFEKYRAKPR